MMNDYLDDHDRLEVYNAAVQASKAILKLLDILEDQGLTEEKPLEE